MVFNPTLGSDSKLGFNLQTLNTIATKAPIVGGIVSNLGSVAKLAGIHVDTTSPAQHIAERTANAEQLKQAAISGSNLAWEKLWLASSRALPVQRVDTVPQLQGNQFIGWARVGEQTKAMLREVEAARGALPPPTGLSQTQVLGMSTAQVLAGPLQHESFGASFSGVGDSPQQHDVAQSNAPPSSTNYVVVGALILAMLYVLKKRG